MSRLLALVSLLLLGAFPYLAFAQGAPLRIIVGYPAGGSADAVARALADPLQKLLSRSVVVDNRPGAGGMIAGQLLKSAPADDNSVLLVNDHMVSMIPWTMKDANYSASTDFVSLGQAAKFNLAFSVSNKAGAKTVSEFLSRAKTDPRVASVGIPAPGSVMQFVGFVLGKGSGVDLVPLPYKGSAPLVADLIGDQIYASITPVTDVFEHHKAGKLRSLAVTGKARSALLPEVPTFTDLGIKGLEKDNFVGFYAPNGTSSGFTSSFSDALKAVLENSQVRDRLIRLGFEPAYLSPESFAATVKSDSEYWGAVVKQSGFKPQ